MKQRSDHPQINYTARIDQLRSAFEKWGIDALLVVSPYNRRWLTGFTGSAGEVIITKNAAYLATDGRYWSQAQEQALAYTIFQKGNEANTVEKFIEAVIDKGMHVGFEARGVSMSLFGRLSQLNTFQWLPLESTVEKWRSVKSAAEIEMIRSAAAITDSVMEDVPTIAQVGMSERELAWDLEKRMRENGADGLAFDILVASGENAARPHHHPNSRLLQIGDSLIVDMGAKLNGFHSDLTRSFHMGMNPSDQFLHIYNTVLDAQENCLHHMKAGMTGSEIDALTRSPIAMAGYAADYKHSTGHSVGLEIHESPSLRQTDTNTVIPAGAVVTVEPGIYIEKWGGIRIEDLVVVTDNHIERLSHCPKNPLINC